MFLSQTRLRQLLGVLWIIDGLLQLQPQMFTMNMINGIMTPMNTDQPGFVGASLRWIIQMSTVHLTALNIVIAVVQLSIGVLLLTGKWVRPAILASIAWALVVWYGGEGMSMLLTGQASVLTGFPGAVLLYPLLGLIVFPHRGAASQPGEEGEGLLPRRHLRTILGALWIAAALLQLQPYWWQADQISQAIKTMVGGGGLNGVLVDPVLSALSSLTVGLEIPLNIALIIVFLGLGIALRRLPPEHRRPVLIASIVVTALFWYGTEALGMIFSGMATDFNSGLLLILMALSAWPRPAAVRSGAARRERRGALAPESSQPA